MGTYINKEYGEGFPREFLLTAAVGICRSRRLRGQIPTAKVNWFEPAAIFSDSNFRVSSFVAVGGPRHFVSILISFALAYTDSEMELTRTCCFKFDRKRRLGGKVSFLRNIPFYLRLAGFTPLLPLPEVDNKWKAPMLYNLRACVAMILGKCSQLYVKPITISPIHLTHHTMVTPYPLLSSFLSNLYFDSAVRIKHDQCLPRGGYELFNGSVCTRDICLADADIKCIIIYLMKWHRCVPD